MDEGIARGDSNRIADALGIQRFFAPRAGADLKGDAGRYIGGPDRRIFVDQSLQGAKSNMVRFATRTPSRAPEGFCTALTRAMLT